MCLPNSMGTSVMCPTGRISGGTNKRRQYCNDMLYNGLKKETARAVSFIVSITLVSQYRTAPVRQRPENTSPQRGSSGHGTSAPSPGRCGFRCAAAAPPAQRLGTPAGRSIPARWDGRRRSPPPWSGALAGRSRARPTAAGRRGRDDR